MKNRWVAPMSVEPTTTCPSRRGSTGVSRSTPGARAPARSTRPGPLYAVAGVSGWVMRGATRTTARKPATGSSAAS